MGKATQTLSSAGMLRCALAANGGAGIPKGQADVSAQPDVAAMI